MADRFWPILQLDEGASEAEVRRAYARRLREQGRDADVGAFHELRAEFEAARDAARSGVPARSVARETSATAMHVAPSTERQTRERRRTFEAQTQEPRIPDTEANERHSHGERRADVDRDGRRAEPPNTTTGERLPQSEVATSPQGRSQWACAEIRGLLHDGEIARACDRFDLARATNELHVEEEFRIELELAEHWLANTSLDTEALADISRRYHWNDVLSEFPLSVRIVARL